MSTMPERLFSTTDFQLALIRKKAALLPATLRGHFLSLVAARVGECPSDRVVEETARLVQDQIQAITNDADLRL